MVTRRGKRRRDETRSPSHGSGGLAEGVAAAAAGAGVVAVDRSFADQVAEIAELLTSDDREDAPLLRLTELGAGLVPGCSAAAVTISGREQGMTFAASDPRVDDLHQVQFETGQGPAVETLVHNEPRRVDDTGSERRWPGFCHAARDAGFRSCLVLPLRTDRRPSGAIALYGEEPDVFQGSAHDIALLFAAQGGTAVRNARLYRKCQLMVANLHQALESRAAIDQAKGLLRAEFGVSPGEAFELLSRFSQRTNTKVRVVAADLIAGRIDLERLRPSSRGRHAGPAT